MAAQKSQTLLFAVYWRAAQYLLRSDYLNTIMVAKLLTATLSLQHRLFK